MDARDRIPLSAIDKAGALHVPVNLSRETAERLVERGWVHLAFVSRSPTGRAEHHLATLTHAGGLALLNARATGVSR